MTKRETDGGGGGGTFPNCGVGWGGVRTDRERDRQREGYLP